MNLLTAMEIYGNPNDLVFFVAKSDKSKFHLCISRGPGHNFKLILTSSEPLNSKKETIDIIEKVLRISLRLCDPNNENNESFLTQEKVGEILDGLEKKNKFCTFKV